MHIRKLLPLGLFAILFATSCVSPRQLKYLQDQGETQTDSSGYQTLDRSQYKVQINDIITVNVRSFDSEATQPYNIAGSDAGNNFVGGDLIFYLSGYSIDQQGNIELPVLGPIHVAGLTIDEIKKKVETDLNTNYFKDSAVYVTVQLAGIRISVVGEVARPGKFTIFENQVSIFEAIANAGDATFVANRKEVQVIRQYPDGVKIHEIDLTDRNVINSPYYFLQPNDIVNVPPLKVKSVGTGTTGIGTFTTILSAVSSVLLIVNLLQ